MATTETISSGDGTTTQFSFTFPYIKTEDVRVELQEFDTVESTVISRVQISSFSIPANNPTVIQFAALGAATNYQAITGAPLTNHAVNTSNIIRVRIYRFTSSDANPSTFIQGSAVRAQDLNDNFEQILYIMQERQNTLQTIQLGGIGENIIGTVSIQDDAITADKLRDSTVTDSDRAVTTNHIRNDAVTPAKLSTGGPYWDSSGNVGIGTTSPSELLQVDGGNLLVRNNSGNNITLSTNVGNKNDSNFIFQKARGSSSGPTQIVADDNLGTIEWQGYDGSSYNEAAKIISRARTNTGNFDADLIYDANGHNFKNNGSSSVFIDSSGRLLIGTIASPAYQLEVSTDSAGKPSTNTWTIVSDERIKEDIELADLDICYEAVKNIPLKRFKWKDEVYTEEQVPDRHKLGWIAQDVESVFPKAVCIHEFKYNQVFEETVIPAVEEELDEDGNVITPAQPERVEKGELISEDVIEDCRDLNADQLYAAMYGAIQKLIAKVETLEAKVATLENV